MCSISHWRGKSSCHPGRPILLPYSPSIMEPIIPFSQYLSSLCMGTRQVCHRDLLVNLQRLCFKVLKTHLVVVVAVKSTLYFAKRVFSSLESWHCHFFLIVVRSSAILCGKWRWETLRATGMRPSAE